MKVHSVHGHIKGRPGLSRSRRSSRVPKGEGLMSRPFSPTVVQICGGPADSWRRQTFGHEDITSEDDGTGSRYWMGENF